MFLWKKKWYLYVCSRTPASRWIRLTRLTWCLPTSSSSSYVVIFISQHIMVSASNIARIDRNHVLTKLNFVTRPEFVPLSKACFLYLKINLQINGKLFYSSCTMTNLLLIHSTGDHTYMRDQIKEITTKI